MTQQTFLVEIGTEELPPKALRSLAQAFADNFRSELDNAGLAHGDIAWFAAPRRLALKVAALDAAQPDREIENVARPLLRPSMPTASRPRRPKVGLVAAGSASSRLSA